MTRVFYRKINPNFQDSSLKKFFGTQKLFEGPYLEMKAISY